MGLRPYNGWSGQIRQLRDDQYRAAVKAGWHDFRKDPCEICGTTGGVLGHCEEYGPTFQDFYDDCHPLCHFCHALLHMRFQKRGLWEELKRKAALGTLRKPPSFGRVIEAYRSIGGTKDIPFDPWEPEEHGAERRWWDGLGYSVPPVDKVADLRGHDGFEGRIQGGGGARKLRPAQRLAGRSLFSGLR